MTDQRAPVRTVARAVDVLDLIGSSPRPMSFTDIANTLDIPRSSLHDLLKTLVMKGLVDAVGERPNYALSIRMLQLGRAYIDSSTGRGHVDEVLEWVADRIDETVHVGRLIEDSIVYIGKREPSHPIRLYSAIGRSLPVHATAMGKAVLAMRTDEEVAELLPAKLPTLTPNTRESVESLIEDLRTVREQGFAVDDEESMDGVLCHAVALSRDEALSVSVLKWRMKVSPEEIVATLVEARDAVYGGSSVSSQAHHL